MIQCFKRRSSGATALYRHPSWPVFAAVLALAGFAVPAYGQISLLTAVSLAQQNSESVHIAQADLKRAEGALSETKDAYVPSMTGGSSVGYSYGFPVGQPTLFNFQAQSLVVSFSQPDYIRAARAAVNSASLQMKDALEQVQLDAALDYLQLNTITQQLAALSEEKSYAERLDSIEQARLDAGMESRIAATKAELSGAQADLKRLDLQAQATVLREQLSHLTGLPPDDLTTEPASVPGPPVHLINPLPQRTASVDASYSNALSKHYIAHGDSRQNYRPQIGFGFNYQLFDTSLNDYNKYYTQPLQANNFSVGVQVTIPLFDATKRAQARVSAAEAAEADAQAAQARQRVDENVVELQTRLPELRAQARIAELQSTLASQQLQAILLEMQKPPASPNAAPVTPADEMEARINERARFSDALDARFAVLKEELSLLRLTGGLSAWITSGAR